MLDANKNFVSVQHGKRCGQGPCLAGAQAFGHGRQLISMAIIFYKYVGDMRRETPEHRCIPQKCPNNEQALTVIASNRVWSAFFRFGHPAGSAAPCFKACLKSISTSQPLCVYIQYLYNYMHVISLYWEPWFACNKSTFSGQPGASWLLDSFLCSVSPVGPFSAPQQQRGALVLCQGPMEFFRSVTDALTGGCCAATGQDSLLVMQ